MMSLSHESPHGGTSTVRGTAPQDQRQTELLSIFAIIGTAALTAELKASGCVYIAN